MLPTTVSLWAKSGGNLETFFKENSEPITSTFVNSNYFILNDTNQAWVAFDQTWTTETGEKSKAKATITIVKKDKSWKIISCTVIQYDSEDLKPGRYIEQGLNELWVDII